MYGMIHPKALDSFTVRTVFIVDPKKKIRLTMTYPASTGRNFEEILRVIDALQLTDGYKVATPVNWKDGNDVIIPPAIQDPEELKKNYPKGFKTIKPYLRVTPQPNKSREAKSPGGSLPPGLFFIGRRPASAPDRRNPRPAGPSSAAR